MAFPSSIGTKADDLETAWQQIRLAASEIKSKGQRLITISAAGSIGSDEVTDYSIRLDQARVALVRYTAVPGLLAYVREQINDATLDIVAEFNSMLTQIIGVRDWIIANFPKDGSGFLLYHSFDGNGRIQIRQLTTAQTAGLRTQLTALVATID